MWEAVAAVGSAATVLVTATGLGLIWRQIRVTQRISRSQLISELERDFMAHRKAYTSLSPGGEYYDVEPSDIPSEALPHLFLYLGFFEKLNHLGEERLLTAEELGKFFAYRLFIAANNPAIQARILYDKDLGPHFCAVSKLCRKILTTHIARGLPIPRSETQIQLDRCPCAYSRN